MKTISQLGLADNRVQMNLSLFVGLGIVAWVIGVLFIRLAGATFFVEGGLWLVGLYLLTMPSVWLLVKGIALAGKLSGINILMAVAIMNFAALLLDGLAITWLPSIYGLPISAHLLAAAWLLWFVGVSLGASVMMSRTEL